MPLVGGGGAGNTAGGNPAGTGTSLNIIGDHAYAIANVQGATDDSDIQLKFNTGSYYFVGRWTVNGAARAAAPDNGNVTVWTLSMNGTNAIVMKTDTRDEDMPSTQYNDIIIPPYTSIEIVSQSNSDEATNLQSCLITGRIYDA